MIYSQNINKVCAVCQMAHKKSEDEMYCDIKKQAVSTVTVLDMTFVKCYNSNRE